jgi:hypothetical protein
MSPRLVRLFFHVLSDLLSCAVQDDPCQNEKEACAKKRFQIEPVIPNLDRRWNQTNGINQCPPDSIPSRRRQKNKDEEHDYNQHNRNENEDRFVHART